MDIYGPDTNAFPSRPAARRRGYRILRRALAAGLAVAALAGIVAGVVALASRSSDRRERALGLAAIEEIWAKGDYKAVHASCEALLGRRPADVNTLLYSAYSAFYLGLAELDEEAKQSWMNVCVARVRRALALDESLAGQVDYMLGKAYFYKGWHYYDSSAARFEKAESRGFKASDTDEYLAVVYSALGDSAKSLARFEKALSASRNGLLLLAAARAFLDAGQPERAESLAKEAEAGAADAVVRERARLQLADIFKAAKDYDAAERTLAEAIADNPECAEAHFLLGLIYSERGDAVRARSEWRKTVAIDPTHAAARQKLNER